VARRPTAHLPDPDWIAAWRRALKSLPHGELARISDKIGINRNTMSRYTTGAATPGPHTLDAICREMGKRLVLADAEPPTDGDASTE
jgi:DNA-binding phage protein